MEIKGKKVILIPIKPEEKEEFYQLATQSYGSRFWYDKDKRKELTREKFFQIWNEGYFDINYPEKGQCFWVVLKKEKIGQISYNQIDVENKKVEIDIIIGDKDNMGKGYGPDVLRVLTKYLFESFDINKILIKAQPNNTRAIKAYEKVGFKKEGVPKEEDHFGRFIGWFVFKLLKEDLK
jgi:RimJ/RimL family protein N-acetyltransferase